MMDDRMSEEFITVLLTPSEIAYLMNLLLEQPEGDTTADDCFDELYRTFFGCWGEDTDA